jgi:hypothetical protein
MKTKVLKNAECDPGDQVFPKKITLEAESRDEEELLDFLHGINQRKGLVPTIDIILDMISRGLLVQRGDAWSLRADALLSRCQSEMMYG